VQTFAVLGGPEMAGGVQVSAPTEELRDA